MSIVVAEGVVEVTADGKGVPRAIAKDIDDNNTPIEGSGNLLGSNLSIGVGRGLLGLGKVTAVALGAVALAVGAGIGAIVVNGVAFESSMQNYTAAFTPLLGGADAAEAKLGELSAFAARTPFELTGIADASQTLLSFGVAGDDLLPTLNMLGDISQGNQEKFSGLSLVFGQVASSGRLMGQDVLQMINQGFNPLVEISKMTGESMVDLKARMEAGGISFEEVKGAMQHATEAGGMFYGSMALGAQTLTGSWSSAQDGARILSGTIIGDLTPALTGILSVGVNPLLGGLVDLVNGVAGADTTVATASQHLLNQVEGLGDVAKDLAGNISTVIGAVGPSISSLVGTLITSLVIMLPSIIGLAGQIVTTLVTAIADNAPTLVTTAVPLLLSFVGGLLGQLPTLIQTGVDVLLALVNGITAGLPVLIPQVVTAIVDSITTLFAPENLTALLDAGLGIIMGLAEGIITALPGLIEALPGIILGIVTFLTDAIPTIIETGIKLLLSLVEALPEIITGIVDAIPKIIVGLVTALVEMQPRLIEAGIDLFLSLIDALPTIIESTQSAVPKIVTGLFEAFTNPATVARLSNAGMQLLHGLWQGISDTGAWLWGKVSGFFGGLVDNIKGFFGIHSPSTLMHDLIGTNLGLGVGGGFIESLLGQRAGVMGALGNLVDTVTGGLGTMGIEVSGNPGDGLALNGPGVTSSTASQAALARANGTTITIGSITLDASQFKTLQELIDMIEALTQAARQGRGPSPSPSGA